MVLEELLLEVLHVQFHLEVADNYIQFPLQLTSLAYHRYLWIADQ